MKKRGDSPWVLFDPGGIQEGGRTIYPTGGYTDRWWRCAYHRLIASIPPGSGAPDGYSG